MRSEEFDHPSLIKWGYIASHISCFVRAYREGKKTVLNNIDKNIIKECESFLEAIIKGCDLIQSHNNLFTYKKNYPMLPISAFNFAYNILFAPFPSLNLISATDMKNKFLSYKKILNDIYDVNPKENLETTEDEENFSIFLDKICEQADKEIYEHSIAD